MPVQPRACGEWDSWIRPSALCAGSAPRVRGMGWGQTAGLSADRFSPARAGNGLGAGAGGGHHPVQPRACGEWHLDLIQFDDGTGSAPRVRGMVSRQLVKIGVARFSPARAGNGLPRQHCISIRFTMSNSAPAKSPDSGGLGGRHVRYCFSRCIIVPNILLGALGRKEGNQGQSIEFDRDAPVLTSRHHVES